MGSKRHTGRRIACYATFPFHIRSLGPIAQGFEESLISSDIKEIEAWRPDVIVTADFAPLPSFRKHCDAHNVILIGMRHGSTTKYHAPEPQYRDADYMLASDYDVEDFSRAGAVPRKGFLLTGNPWVDSVFRIPKRELNSRKPTILFAPTYNPEVTAAGFFQGRLCEMIRLVYPESRIIIKPHPAIMHYDHPQMSQNRDLFKGWVDEWRHLAASDPKVFLVEDPAAAIGDFFAETDILISDGSSLIFEFMALNRPILLYSSTEQAACWVYDDNAPGNAWRDVGPQFTTDEQFESALREAFDAHSRVYSANQQAHTDELYGRFQDGKSVERAIEALRGIPYLDVVISTDGNDEGLESFIDDLHARVSNCVVTVVHGGSNRGSVLNEHLKASGSPYVMVIDYKPGRYPDCAEFINEALNTMYSDPDTAMCGRAQHGADGGYLETNYSILNREAVLSVGGFSESLTGPDADRDLTQRIIAGGLVIHSAWDSRAVVVFGDGFHPAERDLRWMSDSGTIKIGRSVTDEAESRPVWVRFDLTCTAPSNYGEFPFRLQVYQNDEHVTDVQFQDANQTVTVYMPPVRATQTIRLTSSASYIPSELGINGDPRRLSVVLRNLSVLDESDTSLDMPAAKREVVCGCASLYHTSGRTDDAVRMLRDHINADPEHAQGHNDLGVLYCETGDIRKAQEHLENACKQDGMNPDYHKNLADLYLAIGLTDDAIRIYEHVLSLCPSDCEVLLRLGEILQSSDRLSDALACYRSVLISDPDNKEAKAQLAALMNTSARSAAVKVAELPSPQTRCAPVMGDLQCRPDGRPRIIAIFAVFNEADVIRPVIEDFIRQDIECYILDHNSTDDSMEQIADLVGKGIIKIERFPEESGMQIPNNVFALRYILMRKEQLVRELGPAWYINADVDEFRESPWPGLSLREGIERVDAHGYNAVNFTILDFHPTDNSFVPGADVRDYLTHYADAKVSWDNIQTRCWKHWGQEFQLWQTGGHLVEFENRRIYPVPFVLRHYPIRSQQHGELKIFNERKKRFDQQERSAQWHVQYDNIEEETHNFLRDKSELAEYNRDQVCAQILRRFAGITSPDGIERRMVGNAENLTSIIVLAYNQIEYTRQCLESVMRNTTVPFELVLVDNGSADGTGDYLDLFKADWENGHNANGNCLAVKVVRHDRNLGYAAGNNSGMAAAEGAYICILNNDIVVTPGWLEHMTRCAESDPRIGIIGPMSNRVSGAQLVSDVSYDQETLDGVDDFAVRWADECENDHESAFRLIGFCLLVKRAVIEKIGGLDTRFGLGNFEDDDFCLRSAIAGFRGVIARKSFVHHFGSRTFKGERIDHEALMTRNWLIYKDKWRLPDDLPLRAPYDAGVLMQQEFDPDLHYQPLSVAFDELGAAGKWYMAPDWSRPEMWCDVMEQYVRVHTPADGSLLQLYAGYLTGSHPDSACVQMAEFLERIGVGDVDCPDIEITSDLPTSPSIRVVLTGSTLDDQISRRFPGRCISVRRQREAA